MAQLQVQKVNWWHERLADWMLANPDKVLKDAAKEFNCTPQCIYIIRNSDAFQIYWATRSGDYSDALSNKTLEARSSLAVKAAAVAEAALEELGSRLDTAAVTMPIDQLLDISKMGLNALGYKANSKQQASVQVNINAVDSSALQRARERIEQVYGTKVETSNPQTIDAVSVELLD